MKKEVKALIAAYNKTVKTDRDGKKPSTRKVWNALLAADIGFTPGKLLKVKGVK